MQKVIIIGSGDQAKVIFHEIINDKKIKVIGFGDENRKKNEIIIKFKNKNYKILDLEDISYTKKTKFIIGIGHNFLREKICNELYKKNKNIKFLKYVSKDSIINKNVKIGDGTIIMPGCVLNKGVRIGSHCIINTSSSIDHDNYFLDFSSCGPGVISGGNVIIEERSHVGIGTVIKNNIKIKNDTVIGGKSYVNKNCEPLKIYFGNPAKKIKKRLSNQNYL